MKFEVRYDKNKDLKDSVYEEKQRLYKEHKLQVSFFRNIFNKRPPPFVISYYINKLLKKYQNGRLYS